ncbi:MAG: transmembrane 220 family protein [Runella sp.]
MNLTKILSLVLAVVFIVFAAVQYNDPDPELWIPIYGIAALACLSIFWGKAPRQYVFVVLALAYFFAAYRQWPPHYEGVFWGEMQMRSINIEMARESLGLMICGLGMALMAWLRK